MFGRFSLGALLFSVVQLTALNGQSCLRTNGILPSLQDYSSTDLNFGTIRHRHQAIIPSYKFSCYGNITEWGVNVYPANSIDQHMYILDLQVWRPSPTVHTTSFYSLVGNNRFTSVLLSGGVARVTPLPQNRIQFQPGDVLGFYVESTRVSNAASRGVVILNDRTVQGDRGFQTEEVWYANIAHHHPSNYHHAYPYAVGPHGVLNTFTNAAPVISVSTTIVEAIFPTSSLTYTSATIYNQPYASSTLATTATPMESSWPTPEQVTSTNQVPVPQPAGIITGVVLAPLFIIIIGAVVIVVLGVVLCRKPNRRHLSRNNSMITNAVYGTTFDNMAATSRRGDTYDYPRFGLRLLKSIRGKKHPTVHSSTTVAVEGDEPGNTYTMMDFSSQRNEAYGASFSSLEDDFEYSYVRYL